MGIERPHRQTTRWWSPIKSSLHDVIQNRQRTEVRCKLVFLRVISSHSKEWWSRTGSNRRPPACKAGALPAELIPHRGLCSLKMIRLRRAFLANAVPNESRFLLSFDNVLVGLVGFEPTTPALSRRCSNQLSYRPRLPLSFISSSTGPSSLAPKHDTRVRRFCRQQQPIRVSA